MTWQVRATKKVKPPARRDVSVPALVACCVASAALAVGMVLVLLAPVSTGEPAAAVGHVSKSVLPGAEASTFFNPAIISWTSPAQAASTTAEPAAEAEPSRLATAGVMQDPSLTGQALVDTRLAAAKSRGIAPQVEAMATDSLSVQPGTFVPMLARAEPPASAVADSPVSLLFGPEGAMLPETLRIISRMSPEQLDALTLLLLAKADGAAGAGLAGVDDASTDAPWVGDWSEADQTGPETTDAGSDGVLPDEWQLIEKPDGSLFVLKPGDPFSAILARPGMVLGEAGTIVAVEKSNDRVALRFAEDRRIFADRNAGAVTAEQTALARARVEIARRDAAEKQERAAVQLASQPKVATDAEGSGRAVESGDGPKGAPKAKALKADGKKWIQVGSYRSAENAAKVEKVLKTNGFETQSFRTKGGGDSWFVVRASAAAMTAVEVLDQLQDLGFPDAVVLAKASAEVGK